MKYLVLILFLANCTTIYSQQNDKIALKGLEHYLKAVEKKFSSKYDKIIIRTEASKKFTTFPQKIDNTVIILKDITAIEKEAESNPNIVIQFFDIDIELIENEIIVDIIDDELRYENNELNYNVQTDSRSCEIIMDKALNIKKAEFLLLSTDK